MPSFMTSYPAYRVYSDQIDRRGYTCIPIREETPNPDIADFLAAYQKILVKVKIRFSHIFRFSDNPEPHQALLTFLNLFMEVTTEEDAACFKDKTIDLSKFFSRMGIDPQKIDSNQLYCIFAMACKANAKFTLESIELVLSFAIKMNLDFKDFLKAQNMSFALYLRTSIGIPDIMNTDNVTILKFLSSINPDSFISSPNFFHMICASERTGFAEAIIDALKVRNEGNLNQQFVTFLDRHNRTPLIAATLFGADNAALKLLEMHQGNVDVLINAKDVDGFNALDYAMALGRTEIVEKLLKKGAQYSNSERIRQCYQESDVDMVLNRAGICGERHHKAMCNYFPAADSRELPLMVLGNSISDWKFVLFQPTNTDAVKLVTQHPKETMDLACKHFQDLTRDTNQDTYLEHLTKKKNDPAFLRALVVLFVKRGMHHELKEVISKFQSPECDLLRLPGNRNLLHLCSNSYDITNKDCPITFDNMNSIIEGRKNLVSYFCQHYPALLVEKTPTSRGEETFFEICSRMNAKCNEVIAHDPKSVFNNLLFTQLFQLIQPLIKVGPEPISTPAPGQ